MDHYLARRVTDRRFGAHPPRSETERYGRLMAVKDNASICWEGYERVPGTERYSNDSCRKKGSGPKRKKERKMSKKGDGGEAASSSSSSDDEGAKTAKKKKTQKKTTEGPATKPAAKSGES